MALTPKRSPVYVDRLTLLDAPGSIGRSLEPDCGEFGGQHGFAAAIHTQADAASLPAYTLSRIDGQQNLPVAQVGHVHVEAACGGVPRMAGWRRVGIPVMEGYFNAAGTVDRLCGNG
jgi:hypothetical protein